ncbi:MAG: DUF6800 family protein [Planctomycetaceae bacterium]
MPRIERDRELARKRTRKVKLRKFRAQYAAAKNQTEKQEILEKADGSALSSIWMKNKVRPIPHWQSLPLGRISDLRWASRSTLGRATRFALDRILGNLP